MACYAGLRTTAVWTLLSEHGADPVVFACIDLSSAVPYGYAWPRLADCVAERRYPAAARWLAVALVAFAAPYGYLFWAAPQYPSGMMIGLIGLVALAGVSAAVGMHMAVAARRTDTESGLGRRRS